MFDHGSHVVRAMEVYKEHFYGLQPRLFLHTPYGMNLAGVTGYAPVVEIRNSRDGRFISGQVHSFIQRPGEEPRLNTANVVACEMRALSINGCPTSALRIAPNGRVWIQHP